MHVIVSDHWLNNCGEQRLSGVPLLVDHVRDYGPQRGKFYHVILPNGNSWVVWDQRGVLVLSDEEEERLYEEELKRFRASPISIRTEDPY